MFSVWSGESDRDIFVTFLGTTYLVELATSDPLLGPDPTVLAWVDWKQQKIEVAPVLYADDHVVKARRLEILAHELGHVMSFAVAGVFDEAAANICGSVIRQSSVPEHLDTKLNGLAQRLRGSRARKERDVDHA